MLDVSLTDLDPVAILVFLREKIGYESEGNSGKKTSRIFIIFTQFPHNKFSIYTLPLNTYFKHQFFAFGLVYGFERKLFWGKMKQDVIIVIILHKINNIISS